MWEQYCDDMRTGSRDPARHEVKILRNFLDAHARGEQPKPCQIGDGRVLRLRGVPFQSEIAHVAEFLSEYGVLSTDVVMGHNAEGKRTGEAYVVFQSREDAE